MPVLDGFATLEAMQADPRLRDVPVIVISDVDDRESVVRCLRMGAVDHLPKTVDPEILRARIEASLTRKRLHDVERRRVGGPGPPARDDRPAARRAVAVPVAAGRRPRLERGR